MSEFQREERYIVIKLKHQSPGKRIAINELLDNHGIDTIECVVVESDWSIYEETWENVQRLAEGEASIGQERDELARKARYHQQEIDRLVGRLRDTQSKRDALAAQLERFNELYRRATEEDAWWMANSAVVKEYSDLCRDTPETSLALHDAELLDNAALLIDVCGEARPYVELLRQAASDKRRQAGGDV